MKKLILIFLLISQFAQAQIVTVLDIADISGADTTIWMTKDQSKFSYSLGVLADFKSISAGAGTFEFLNSPVREIELVMPSGTVTVTGDGVQALISDVVPFEFIGFRMIKGTLTSGIVTYYFSRKQRR
ncbi:MAG: hypothetical protein ACUZ8E_05655 [Candidatus Anammoxibacter sp.]